MVKIVEEEEEESETNPNRLSLDSSPLHSPSPRPSTSSSHHHQDHHSSPPPSHPSSPPPGTPASPGSPSSLSSGQTYHGFSPKASPPPTSIYHPQEPGLASLSLSPAPSPLKDAVVVNRLIRDEPAALVTKTESGPATGFADEGGTPDDEAGVRENKGGGEGQARRGRTASFSVLQGARREVMVRRMALGLRVCEFVLCLISFSIMAADKNRGWALDSFDRYKEFRYCMSVNVIGFAYSGLQGYSVAHQLANGKQIICGHFGCYFDFLMDQILAYLLVSASSSAATRVDDWVLNWGKDIFTTLASASVGMSFLAFLAFALSSLISGYMLCTRRG